MLRTICSASSVSQILHQVFHWSCIKCFTDLAVARLHLQKHWKDFLLAKLCFWNYALCVEITGTDTNFLLSMSKIEICLSDWKKEVSNKYKQQYLTVTHIYNKIIESNKVSLFYESEGHTHTPKTVKFYSSVHQYCKVLSHICNSCHPCTHSFVWYCQGHCTFHITSVIYVNTHTHTHTHAHTHTHTHTHKS